MIIDQETCIACESCVPYCPVEAISVSPDGARIDQDQCVECGVCVRAGVCPVDAIVAPALEWPRTLRSLFSNPITVFEETGVAGRGTDEVKSNDVTGRFKRGEVGFGIELGRPGTGATFRQVQQVAEAIAAIGVAFEKKNPLTTLFSDPGSGKIREDILDERVLTAIIEFKVSIDRTAIIEFKVSIDRVGSVLAALERAAADLETVFSVDYISRPDADGKIPAVDAARKAGYRLSDHVKICTGLGRPKID